MPVPTTESGRGGLAAITADPGAALVALDYDGTLAPIVSDPGEARLLPGMHAALLELGGTVGRLVVVTARAAEAVLELGRLADVPSLVVLGQYGAQRWQDGELTSTAPHPGLEQVRAALALPPGAVVEDKGLSLTIHVRGADRPDQLLVQLRPSVQALADAAGLAVHDGRLVLELRPPGQDKGTALCREREGWAALLVVGDDLGDLSCFAEVDALRREGGQGLKVCSDSDEAPPQLRDDADLLVPGPAGVLELLTGLTG